MYRSCSAHQFTVDFRISHSYTFGKRMCVRRLASPYPLQNHDALLVLGEEHEVLVRQPGLELLHLVQQAVPDVHRPVLQQCFADLFIQVLIAFGADDACDDG